MDKRRATEIASSLETVNVTYQGKPVYIEQINAAKDTASVHYLSQPEHSQEVALNQLIEP